MTPQPPLPADLWHTLPIEARTLFEAMQRQIHALQAEVQSLKDRLGSNSRNSSRPPSTDPLHLKRQPSKTPSGKKRGGQPGHKRATRPLVPPDQVGHTIACKPTACSGCGGALDGSDLTPHRHQVAEIPPIRPIVVEYLVHRLTCPGCGVTTRGVLPEGVPTGSFGPRLQATLSLLTGERLAKRPVQRLAKDVLGLDISLGMVPKLEAHTAAVLEPVDAELAGAVRHDPWAHSDETSWRQAGVKVWLWIARSERATHFRISPHRDADTAKAMLGTDDGKVVICDRYSGSTWVKKKQWCWAHLRRDFQAMIDRDDGGTAVGQGLRKRSNPLFWGWHRVADGALSWDDFLCRAVAIQIKMWPLLEVGASCSSSKTAGICRRLRTGWEHMWRFLAGDGVEPTNNAAERGLRHSVMWRKTSGGTASVAGSQFVSRLLSVIETCRQQGRSVLDFLTSCFEANLRSQPVPSLLGP